MDAVEADRAVQIVRLEEERARLRERIARQVRGSAFPEGGVGSQSGESEPLARPVPSAGRTTTGVEDAARAILTAADIFPAGPEFTSERRALRRVAATPGARRLLDEMARTAPPAPALYALCALAALDEEQFLTTREQLTERRDTVRYRAKSGEVSHRPVAEVAATLDRPGEARSLLDEPIAFSGLGLPRAFDRVLYAQCMADGEAQVASLFYRLIYGYEEERAANSAALEELAAHQPLRVLRGALALLQVDEESLALEGGDLLRAVEPWLGDARRPVVDTLFAWACENEDEHPGEIAATLLREGFGHRGAPLEWYERVLDPSLSEKGLRDSTRDALFEVWVPDLIRRRGVPQLSTRALEVLLTDGGAYYRDRAVEQLLDTGDPGARRLQQLASNASPHLRRALAQSIRRPGLDPPRRLQRELERELEGETP